MRNVMPLPELKYEIFRGLMADKEIWIKKFHEIRNEVPVLYDMIEALLQDAEKEKYADEIKVGILQGVVYTYMLYQAQADADDLANQWGGV